MKILLIAPSNYDYSFKIQEELEKNHHIVTYIEDKVFPLDYYLSYDNKIKRISKILIGKSTAKKERYWTCLFSSKGILYNKQFDLLLCINGYSLISLFFKLLKSNSPTVRKIYYLWDSTRLYAFPKFFHYFDKISTFDYHDSKIYNINYLPFYWIPSNSGIVSLQPFVFFFGTLHSDRLKIAWQIKQQLDDQKIKNYIKLYVGKKNKLLVFFRHYINLILSRYSVIDSYYLIQTTNKYDKILTYNRMTLDEFNEKLSLATHIIDIDQPCQTAITPRVMQALAEGKTIITTNRNTQLFVDLGVDSPIIIDRIKPRIENFFLIKGVKLNSKSAKIENYRIDKWIKTLIDY